MIDPYRCNTVLLLPMEGSEGSLVYEDFSSFSHPITVNGGAHISTAQSKWGSGSGYFNGSDGYLSVTFASLFAFGKDDFTVEGWFYPTSLSINSRITNRSSGGMSGTWSLMLSRYCTFTEVTTGEPGVTATHELQTNRWTHIAVCRSSGTLRIYLDGVLSNSAENTTNFYYAYTSLLIGRSALDESNYYSGYMQDLRISRHVARYTNSFTPPDTKFSSFRPSDFEGNYQITGYVDELGVYGAYPVRLFERNGANLIQETWSAADGSYAFYNIAYIDKGYFVVAFDHGADARPQAGIVDLVTPDLMP